MILFYLVFEIRRKSVGLGEGQLEVECGELVDTPREHFSTG